MLYRSDSKTEKWYAVYTRYKCEKAVHEQLLERGITSYLPLYEKVKRYSSRTKRYQIPLITCYVFVKIDIRQRARVLELPNVHSFIRFGKDIIPIPTQEIEILRRLTMEEVELESYPTELKIGDQVEIFAGRLIGLKGRVIRQENRNNFVVDLKSVGYSFQFAVESKNIRKT